VAFWPFWVATCCGMGIRRSRHGTMERKEGACCEGACCEG
jgi:hypothetical protein